MTIASKPQPPGPAWRQISIQFADYPAAESTATAHLGPAMASAETAGLLTAWFFIRKAPTWRLRFLPSDDSTEQAATTFLHRQLTHWRDAGHIANWVETIYEPEVHAFGGPAAMELAHRLFHHDSRHILAYLSSESAAIPGDRAGRRELSILLCSTLLRGARQDWYEQGDIWARVAEHRTLPPGVPSDRLCSLQPKLGRLMTVDADPASPMLQEEGPLAFLADWAAAFHQAGNALGDLACSGKLRRGVRAVLAHHVIFHWNRIGLPYATQSILASTARTVVLGT